MSEEKRKKIMIAIAVIAIISIPCNFLDILPALGAIAFMFIVFLPVWAAPGAIAVFSGVLWWLASPAKPVTRAGICLLVVGLIIGLGLPFLGSLQPLLVRILGNMRRSDELQIPGYYPNSQALTVECAILPGGDVPPGVTVFLTNTTTAPITYHLFLGQITGLYQSNPRVPVDLGPGESRRLSQPLAFWMLGPQVIAISHFLASCSMYWASRYWLVAFGALLALAGLLCLGLDAYWGRKHG